MYYWYWSNQDFVCKLNEGIVFSIASILLALTIIIVSAIKFVINSPNSSSPSSNSSTLNKKKENINYYYGIPVNNGSDFADFEDTVKSMFDTFDTERVSYESK